MFLLDASEAPLPFSIEKEHFLSQVLSFDNFTVGLQTKSTLRMLALHHAFDIAFARTTAG